MKSHLVTETLETAALKEMLAQAELLSSRAAQGATVYQIKHLGQERVLITLPEGGAIAVGIAVATPPERRGKLHADP